MSDVFLRADNRETIDAALMAAGLITADGHPGDLLFTIDRIGQDPARILGVDGEGAPILDAMPGYHVNLYLERSLSTEEATAIEAVVIDAPGHPFRIRFR